MGKFKFSFFGLGMMVLVLTLGLKPVMAETFKLALPPGVKGLFSYEFEVLEMALEHADGDHSFEFTEIPGLTQFRVFKLLDDGEVSVTVNSYSKEREERFLQVNYPLTRGLLGHRVFLVNPDQAKVLAKVTSLAELKRFCIGFSNDWPDAKVFEDNGFCVVRAPRKQLFAMLEGNRFDLLASTVKQGKSELKLSKKNGFNFVLDTSVTVVYPYDFFFYVRKDDMVRHRILEQGLARAYVSGAFMEHFNSDPGIVAALEEARLSERKVFNIENDELGPENLNIAPLLWLEGNAY
ncbi:MAG: hypothetical protein KTR23_02930 [Rhodospirillales bacterium]|nr:hypothetical protein [Rhodospirillales bacterium]